MATIRTIAVGLDPSDHARRAFDWAAALASDIDAELVAVHAVGLIEHGNHVPLNWFDTLDARGVRLRRVVRNGSPVPTLQVVGTEVGADLLVVGTRGIGGTPSLLLGSTSTQLAQTSNVPVVVVP